jgi:glyoxylase-like metal-dependent hydrolase (beta-lactamase superfamily II)
MAARRLGEQLLAGEIDTTLPPITQSHNVLFEQTPKSGEGHPMLCTAPLECFGPAVSFPDGEAPKPRIWFRLSFANVTVIETTEGLVLIDTGGPYTGTTVYEEVRQKFPKTPVHTAIYTHGHVDHVSGINEFETRDGSRARVISHEAVIQRFDRYKTTQGYNGWINARQFGLPSPLWPEEFRYPDVTYSTFLKIKVGDVDFELYHAKGETDDATWVWIPKYKALCAGDLFIWCVPNCGNPQKVQRYPREWAQALRIMAEKEAELMFPGHGPPISNEKLVKKVRVLISVDSEKGNHRKGVE